MTAKEALKLLYNIVGSRYPQVPSVLEYAVRNLPPEESLRILRMYSKQTDAIFRAFSEAYGTQQSVYPLFRTLTPEVVCSFHCRLVIIEAYLKSLPEHYELPITLNQNLYIIDTMIDLYHIIEPQLEIIVRDIYRDVETGLKPGSGYKI